MSEPPKSFMDKFMPQAEERISKASPEFTEPERKAKAKEFLTVSWGRFSDKKRSEFAEPKTDVPKSEGSDKMFESMFGGSQGSDDEDWLMKILSW